MKGRLLFKIIIAGEWDVGKTSFLQYVLSDPTAGFLPGTDKKIVGINFDTKRLNIDGYDIGVEIMDLGDLELSPITRVSISGAHGAFIIFDLSNLKSLDYINDWANLIHTVDSKIPIMILGNKSDKSVRPEINREFIESIKMEFNIFDYREISIKDGLNVNESFKIMIRRLINEKIS